MALTHEVRGQRPDRVIGRKETESKEEEEVEWMGRWGGGGGRRGRHGAAVQEVKIGGKST